MFFHERAELHDGLVAGGVLLEGPRHEGCSLAVDLDGVDQVAVEVFAIVQVAELDPAHAAALGDLVVGSFAEAAQVVTRLARVVEQYDRSDGARNVQVMLSAWRVEILLAGVDQGWNSRSERELADWIDQNLG